jgi:hypothetical protein
MRLRMYDDVIRLEFVQFSVKSFWAELFVIGASLMDAIHVFNKVGQVDYQSVYHI